MSEKIRILRILNRFNLGGPVYNATYLSKYLNDEFETLLIGGQKLDEEEDALYIPQSAGLKPIVISEMNRSVGLMNDLRSYREIKKIIRDFRPTIVHSHASKAGALGRLAAAHMKVPLIVHTFHGHVFEHYFSRFKTSIIRQTERYLAQKSDAIIAISQKQKEDLTQRFRIANENKVHVVPLGFELDRFQYDTDKKRKLFREKYAMDDDALAIGIIGRLAPVKNHKFFLNGLRKLKDKRVKFKAFVVGDGQLRGELEKYTKSMGLDISGSHPDVVFTSWEKDVSRILPGFEMIVLTSHNEGTPVSLIEAQASGIPVISSEVGGVRDVVCEECGILYQSGDEEAFNDALIRLCESEGVRREMGANGRRWARSKFTAERLAKDMKMLYLDLLNSRIS